MSYEPCMCGAYDCGSCYPGNKYGRKCDTCGVQIDDDECEACAECEVCDEVGEDCECKTCDGCSKLEGLCNCHLERPLDLEIGTEVVHRYEDIGPLVVVSKQKRPYRPAELFVRDQHGGYWMKWRSGFTIELDKWMVI